MEINIEFKSSKTNNLIQGRFIKATNFEEKSPLIFMLTGDGPKGSKSSSWTNMPPKLAKKGISSFLFDFEGLGYSAGSRKKLSLSLGISNLRDAMSEIKSQEWIDFERIGCFASSFGAAVILSCPEIANDLAVLGLKSPASFLADAYYNELSFQEFETWREEGYSSINGYNFEIFIDSLEYNVFSSAKKINTPTFITQGDKDEIVPFQQTIFLYECLKSKKKALRIFKKGNHGYSIANHWEEMATYFVDSFSQNL
ncbi:alpha/beta hydrolase [Fulvivirgaceae bacterium BMA10]|uniref:Alpha/beta hydrolase n=1 Tax=Splendidivirga corallicola TaxID=3051826 RepID=A0ABT8KLG1_9BACT|nr:alpha/beta hydrolase [Fulvivirgaceae bacterium BMA10]